MTKTRTQCSGARPWVEKRARMYCPCRSFSDCLQLVAFCWLLAAETGSSLVPSVIWHLLHRPPYLTVGPCTQGGSEVVAASPWSILVPGGIRWRSLQAMELDWASIKLKIKLDTEQEEKQTENAQGQNPEEEPGSTSQEPQHGCLAAPSAAAS